MANPESPRRVRRRWKILGSVFVLAIVVVACLPAILSSRFARPRIEAALNRSVAPGRLEFDSIELSWFAPTRLSKVVLLDPKRKVVARVPVAVLDKTLANLILPGHAPIVLTLDETALEVERAEDGLIDLAEALKTIIANPNPKRDLTIQIVRGTLNYRDPFLAEPSTADAVDLTLRIPTAPNPVTWSLKLARNDSTLDIQGDFDRWLAKGGPPRSPELQVGVVGKGWPFVAKIAEVDAVGRLDGTLDFARKRGQWILSGDARLNGFRARGKPLGDDSLAIEKLEAGWDLAQGDEGWTVRRLALVSSLGEVKAEGRLTGPGGTGKQRIEAKVDLAAIARQLPHALRLRDGLSVEQGTAQVVVDLRSAADQSTFDVVARLSDLVARDHDRNLTLREPATLSGRLIRKGKDSSVEQLALKTSFLDITAQGRFEDGVNLAGRIDLDGFRRQLGEWVDLGGLDIAGRVELSGRYLVRPAQSLFSPEFQLGNVREAPITSAPELLEADRFVNRFRATVRDLRIDGLGIGPIRRDSITLNLAINGPVDSSGLPRDWLASFVEIRDGATNVRLRLDQGTAGPTSIEARASTPITNLAPPRLAQLDLNGEWSAERQTLSLSEIRLADTGTKRTLAAKGQLDLSSGELTIDPLPGQGTEAVEIAAEGWRISGIGQGLAAIRLEAGLSGDAAALDRLVAELTGRSPLGMSGRWSALASARGDGDGLQMAGKVGLIEPPVATGRATNRPTTLAGNAHYSPKLDRLDLSEFAVTTAYGTLDASGRLDEPLGARRINLNGKLAPDFAVITALLVNKVEPGAKVEGRPREFHASGSLGESAGGWKGLDAEFGFDLLGADIYGMKFGASPVVLHAKGGKLSFDPISTSINEGHIRLEPELDLDAKGGPMLRLAKNSTIREARINDEVSKRVLAYVAPVLDQATRASGLVSVDLDHAEFPLGVGRGRETKVEGAVVFQDVEFAPGPLAGEILGVLGRRDLSLKLDQPVTLTIADGRINQRGMSIPIADFTRIELTGWVDFDRNLALVATVPVTSAMLGNNPLLSDIAAGTKVRLPIGGTLDRPKVDSEAFTNNLQDLAKTLLTRGATRGAMELLMRLARPKDPDAPPAPPRPSPEERKAQRQEKRAIRRGEIPPPDAGTPKL